GDGCSSRPTGSDGLVRALSSTGAHQRGREYRFARGWNPADARDDVLIDAADDDDIHDIPFDRRSVRSASSRMERSAPPGIEVEIRSFSGPVHASPIPSAPTSPPTTDPTVAPTESVSHPPATANAMAAP